MSVLDPGCVCALRRIGHAGAVCIRPRNNSTRIHVRQHAIAFCHRHGRLTSNSVYDLPAGPLIELCNRADRRGAHRIGDFWLASLKLPRPRFAVHHLINFPLFLFHFMPPFGTSVCPISGFTFRGNTVIAITPVGWCHTMLDVLWVRRQIY